MAINPIAYTEKIVRSFLKYQLSAYPFTDPRLNEQMKQQLSLDSVRRTPLLRGPYISLSRAFRQGATVQQLVKDGVFHPHMRQIIPDAIQSVYGHQERAVRSVHGGTTTLVSTGTGSGKSECFLYPIISRCLELNEQKTPAGVVAVIVYPMNALAEDQLDRLRGLLAGSGVTFGMYVGKTPESGEAGYRMPQGSSRADYHAVLQDYRRKGLADSVHPREEVCSREAMRTPGQQPRILLTNVKQLELLLTRQRDVELFDGARLDYLVFDEAHTFTGSAGAETACLIRRLRQFCGTAAGQTTCVATSATIVDQQTPDAARQFAARFFGVPAKQVTTVQEEYEDDDWAPEILPPAPLRSTVEILGEALSAVEQQSSGDAVASVWQDLTGTSLPAGVWQEALFEGLRKNQLAYAIRTALLQPRELRSLIGELEQKAGRPVTEEELLAYLALGAASLRDGRPLLRPVVHGFIRGISGGVVTFPGSTNEPRLWLSSEQEQEGDSDAEDYWRPQLLTCTTCGQHYFSAYLKDFALTSSELEGGELTDTGDVYWEALEEANGGKRVVLLDRLISQDDDGDAGDSAKLHPIHFCRHCGTAGHTAFSRCASCGATSAPVQLFAVQQNPKHLGYLTRCVCCGTNGSAIGRRFREPVRHVRAVNVSDVHVLAQDMVHHAQRKRLLIFCDNRQDAAFQAGWITDHARRFRLRSLMAEQLKGREVSIGELASTVSGILDKNEALSRSLIPEVWSHKPREGNGAAHAEERLYFLRIQVLRELTLGTRQQYGLEPWGRLKVEYVGLRETAAFIQTWAKQLKVPPGELLGGVEALLDQLRRRRLLYDPQRELFNRFWNDGDEEIQRGYLPSMPGPQGMKLTADAADNRQRVTQWMSSRNTLLREIARKWHVPEDRIPDFLTELWQYLISDDVAVLKPVTLRGGKGTALPNCSGVYQIDSAGLMLSSHSGFFRCQRCRRKVLRRPPGDRCLSWQCDGSLEFVGEEPDNYNLQLLDQQYDMLRPKEHTAMVPNDERERIENYFKGESDTVNTLVCTQTLELGVDIGALDAVLMRNVPPLPANYWQRAGRAGRRNRMAVNLTYCRPTSHDRAYFSEPTRMLAGRVDPPAFNLSNGVMVQKHVHATVITHLNQLTRHPDLSEESRQLIQGTLREMLPGRITSYLFEAGGEIRLQPFDLTPLRELISRHRETIVPYVAAVFQQGWPEADVSVTQLTVLGEHVDSMADELQKCVQRLRRRLNWALKEIGRLTRIREVQGTLDREDDNQFNRCDAFVKKMKGERQRRRGDAEGVDDINTFGVLAAEGFLPGYGLDTGSVVATAQVPRSQFAARDFQLPRPTSVALREYVPGNLIYANGNKFIARKFHRDANDEQRDLPIFEVSVDRGAVMETGVSANAASFGSSTLQTIPVCDVDLTHQSQILDDEEFRFQMQVAVFGRERGRHDGGEMFLWGQRQLSHRHNVHLRLVNVGASVVLDQETPQLGYPLCLICGQSTSPLSSERQQQSFIERHEDRCGRKPTGVGFYADIVADCLSLQDCADAREAYSVLEALRMAATSVLDMHLDDLQILVIGHVDRDEVDALLWDPMPGGSGLLQQLRERFTDVIQVAQEIVCHCPSDCEASCIDCLQTYRNSFYHKHLDRHVVMEFLKDAGNVLKPSHFIPPALPDTVTPEPGHGPVNHAEDRLKQMLESAGFTSGLFQEQIRFKQPLQLDHIIGSTTPDVFFQSEDEDLSGRGVCIYLDGMSESIHGNQATADRDREIRTWLRNNDYEVIEITVHDLDDQAQMTRHFSRLGRYLRGRDFAKKLADDNDWYSRIANRAVFNPDMAAE